MSTAAISADSHIVEPPGCYVDHIDAEWRDIAPRVEKNAKGVDAYVIDGLANPIPIGLLAAAGIPSSELIAARRHSFDEINPAAFDPDARIAVQDEENIGGELIFASIGMVLCAHPDYSYKTACMAAYNRWLAGFCARQPTRLFGLAQTAVESVDQTITDMEIAKSLGLVGMMMTGTPQYEDYDHPDYDPVWQAAVDLDLPLCFHILTSKDYDVAATFRPARGHRANGFMNIIRGVQDILGVFVFGGVFERFPQLKLVVAEADAGWVPHWCYRAVHVAERRALGLVQLS
jgi:predicted TIM-barrel fold metal-dependent hydrolase